MIIFAATITPRLQYISDFIGKEVIGEPFLLTDNGDTYRGSTDPGINYSTTRTGKKEFFIVPHSLLSEKDIHVQEIDCYEENGHKAFFKTGGDLSFDIFAASFYLLSRYEEYLPHAKDMYGRYAHENSLAFREDFLSVPLVNIWLSEFRTLLQERFPGINLPAMSFRFVPSYDIDMAWSYREKGWWRNAGGLARSLLRGEWGLLKERIRVLNGRQKDPYDAYGWMNRLHEQYRLKPYYFFLLAKETGDYDKNISPRARSMKELIAAHTTRYPVGIHPSWQSGDKPSLLKDEITGLAAITGSPVLFSRQHYIRFTLPQTFRELIGNGIRFDFSMGYGSINGFRASVASPFHWYDLENDGSTGLVLYPFCFMEANSFYEQKYTSLQALEEMRHYYKLVHSVGGMLITIWHNNFLGDAKMYRGWREVYEEFLEEIISQLNN